MRVVGVCILNLLLVEYASARSIMGFADVSGNDMLNFVAADPARLGTDGVAPYDDQVCMPAMNECKK